MKQKTYESELPAGYQKAYYLNAKDKKVGILFNLIALVIMIAVLAVGVLPLINTERTREEISETALMLFPLGLLLVMLIYIVSHELVHGIFMRLFSKMRVKYGFTALYAYAGSDAYFDKSSYIIIALAPVAVWGAVLALVCALVPPLWFWPLYIIQINNFAGAAGDFYVTARFACLPRDILVRDTGTAMTVFAKSTETV